MNEKAPAKINICLDILGVRQDGYHEVRMIMQNLQLCDEIEINKCEKGAIRLAVTDERGNLGSRVQFAGNANAEGGGPECSNPERSNPECSNSECSNPGQFIPVGQDNLMYRAAEKMIEKYGIESGVEMRLTKRIPAAAGLAGGSADAAAVIRAIDRLFELNAQKEELMELGVSLGADIPYCIMGGTALSEGIGEKLTVIRNRIDLPVLLVKPELGLSTPVVYKQYDAAAECCEIQHPDVDSGIKALEQGDIEMLCGSIGNVLEYAVIPDVPLIETIKKDMCKAGAIVSCMSGSGSTVFGLFDSIEKMHEAACTFRTAEYAEELTDIIETGFKNS